MGLSLPEMEEADVDELGQKVGGHGGPYGHRCLTKDMRKFSIGHRRPCNRGGLACNADNGQGDHRGKKAREHHEVRLPWAKDFTDDVRDKKGQWIGKKAHALLKRESPSFEHKELPEHEVASHQARHKNCGKHQVGQERPVPCGSLQHAGRGQGRCRRMGCRCCAHASVLRGWTCSRWNQAPGSAVASEASSLACSDNFSPPTQRMHWSEVRSKTRTSVRK